MSFSPRTVTRSRFEEEYPIRDRHNSCQDSSHPASVTGRRRSKLPVTVAAGAMVVWIGLLVWLATEYANPTVVPVRLLQQAELVVVGQFRSPLETEGELSLVPLALRVEQVLHGEHPAGQLTVLAQVNTYLGDDRRLRLLAQEGPSIVLLRKDDASWIAVSPLRSSILEDSPGVRAQVAEILRQRAKTPAVDESVAPRSSVMESPR